MKKELKESTKGANIMKLVQYSDERKISLSSSTHTNGIDVEFDGKVILSILPEGLDVKIILPFDSHIKVFKGKLENELS